MDETAGYSPVFRGEFPRDAQSRWAAIHRFFNQWCMPPDAPLADSDEHDGPLVQAARKYCGGQLSKSICRWFSLVQQAAITGAPHVRDCPAVEPIEHYFNDPVARNAMIILVAGEEDVFWAVPNSKLTDDDPPVLAFQKFDDLSPAYIGTTNYVSKFALNYLCHYSEFAVRNRVWFSADGTAEDVEAVREWFEYSLVFDSDEELWGRFGVFESVDAAAIVIRTRLEVSLFRDPDSFDLPPFLRSAMKQHLELRGKYPTK